MGGTVVFWSEDTTQVFSTITAQGGALGGHGGLVETSGKQNLAVTGAIVDTSAPNGAIGTWLLDPRNITVQARGTASLAEVADATDITSNLTIDPATINAALANVVLEASEDIIFNSPINFTNPNVGLTANAGMNIELNASITSMGGDIILNNQGIFTRSQDATLNTSAGGNITLNQNPNGSIQNAVDAIGSLETGQATINLGAGTFTGIVTINTDLTLAGAGQNNTTLQGNSRVVEVGGGVTTTIDGVTITGGTATTGAGIHNEGNLTLTNSTVTGNIAESAGGGIFSTGILIVQNSLISNNMAGLEGGGIYSSDGTVNISDSTITGNSAGQLGGGIFNTVTSLNTLTVLNSTATPLNTLTVTNSTISSNTAGLSGAGLLNSQATAAITNSTISGNNAGISGGGIVNEDNGILTLLNSTVSNNEADEGGGIENFFGTMTISGSTISGNTARLFGGGGIHNFIGALTVENSTISGNVANVGGGIDNDSSVASIANSTITGNAAQFGGGINNSVNRETSSQSFSGIAVRNSIVAGNSATSLPNTAEVLDTAGTFVSNGFNLVGQFGNANGFITSPTDSILGGAISTAIGPLADNGGPTMTHALVPGSPAFDAGNNGLIPPDRFDLDGDGNPEEPVPFDQRGPGFDRVLGGTVDIGAVEMLSPLEPPSDPPVVEEPPPGPPTGGTPPSPPMNGTPSPPPTGGTPPPMVGEPPPSIVLDNPRIDEQIIRPSPPMSSPRETRQSINGTQTDRRLEARLSNQYRNHLGVEFAIDTPESVVATLQQVVQEGRARPAVIYITRIAKNSERDAIVSREEPRVASAQLSSLGLQGTSLAQQVKPESSQCLPGDSVTPNEPLWQFDSCGWENLFPDNQPLRETDQVSLVLVTPTGKITRMVVEAATYKQVVAKVTEFHQQVTNFRSRPSRYLPVAQQLYQWLIAPMEATLEAEEINNLVFILDEGLRSMPFAALHDGTGYVVERYSVGLMPSMSLSDTTPTDVRGMNVLAMGADEFTDEDPLPAVPIELSTIADRLWLDQSQSLLNEGFTPDNLKQLRNSGNYGIVHLATHGDFNTGDPNNSYVQFWNDKVTLDKIQELELTLNNPVSLLVLSACRTALGDRQAELGFTGLAVASGVQTAVGGLWYVSDIGTLGLMTNFYSQLKVAPIRAEALRQAQVAMINGQVQIEQDQLLTAGITVPLPEDLQGFDGLDLSHPYFWSGMTMVGNPW